MSNRVRIIRIDLNDLSAELCALDGDAEYADWLRGFLRGTRGAPCDSLAGTARAMGHMFGLAAYSDALTRRQPMHPYDAMRRTKKLRQDRMAAARAQGTHTVEEWEALRALCNHLCVKCGAQGHQDRDHIHAVYLGGSDSIDNIQPLCAVCNSGKRADRTDYRRPDWRERMEALL